MDKLINEPPFTLDELISYSNQNSSTLIVINFKATWCKPCKAIKPFIDYLKDSYPKVEFYEIDISDDSRDTIISYFDIVKVPTCVFYKNGNICNTLLGTDQNKLEELVNEYL